MAKASTAFAVGFSAMALLLLSSASPATALTDDGLALLALKSAVSRDPTRALSAWLESDRDPCAWRAVACRGGRVTAVSLTNLSLHGYLPSELSLLSSLETLSLSHNRFSGQIPNSIGELKNLISLDLSHNSLSGPVPAEIGALDSLIHLDLSSNYLNGSLPPAIAALPTLAGVLNLSCNLFSGKIPPAYGGLPVAVSLDLRQNQLAGEIPEVGSLLNQGPTAFAGNPGLCGFPLKNLCGETSGDYRLPLANPSMNPMSPAAAAEERHGKPAVMIAFLAGIIIIALASVLVLQWHFRRRRRAASDGKLDGKGNAGGSPARNDWRGNQQVEIYVAVDESFGIELEELLRASAYVVGKSRCGIVYKVVISRGSDGSTVAVRRLSESDDGEGTGGEWRRRREFEAEATAIGRANHPNVVRLRAYYYAADEKLLIYDYIPNGNLCTALHGGLVSPAAAAPPSPPAPLPWAARLAILQGAARGLAYLHECGPRKYAHGNVKSSKILLGDDLHPYVSGFGVTRLQRRGGGTKKAAEGYAAPELRGAAETATQKGDVYAFGVVMMEAATGKAAEAGMEEWVRRAFAEERPLTEVVDPALLKEVHEKPQVLAVFHIALGCTEAEPEARPRMKAVAEGLDRIGPAS